MVQIQGIALAAFATLFSFTAAQDRVSSYVSKCVNDKDWAMTFDDGPHANTPELLKILDAENVKATFFVIGVQLKDPAMAKILKDTYNAGHDISCHSENHKSFNTLTADQIKDEVNLCAQAVKDIIGVYPVTVRPPLGDCSEPSGCTKIVEGLGQTVVIWNADCNDWKHKDLPEEERKKSTIGFIEEAVRTKLPSVISLHHDIHQFSVKLVPEMIKIIKGGGYKLVNMQQCLGGKTPIYKGVTPSAQIVKSPTDSKDKINKVNSAFSLSPISYTSFGITALAAFIANLF